MKPSYKELLPSYLDGPNIRAHAEIIDKSTQERYNKLGILETWNNLTRPVLIKKEQTQKYNATYTVYVDIPYAIQSINISGDYEASVFFSEEDCVTSHTLSFPFSVDAGEGMVEFFGFANAQLEVTVETYEGYTYKKGYPENDTLVGDVYDHDKLLDMLGTVLTIPRRHYSQFQYTDMGVVAPTIPEWFGKEAKQIQGLFGKHWYILDCTEDDYYYSQRLQQFIQDFMADSLSLEKSKLRAVYNATVTEEINYNDLICYMDVDNMDAKEMAVNNTSESNTYVYKVGVPEYINLPVPSFDDLSEFIRSFVSVTKNVLVVEDFTVQVGLLGELLDVYYEDDVVSIPIRVTTSGGKPIPGIRVRAGWISNWSTDYTDENGIFTYEKTLKYSSSAVAFSVDVYDLTPYTGTSVEYPSSIIEQEVIPITMDLYVVSSDTSGVTLGVDFLDEDEQPFTCDANLTLIFNQNTWQTSMENNNTVNISTTGLSFPAGSTYTFRVASNITTRAPRGYKYTAQSETIDVKIGSGELIPVTLDTTVTTVSKTKISVDVEFLNTTTGNPISLDGTITLTIDYGPGSPQQLLDTKTLSNESSVTLENGSGFIFPDGTYPLIIRLGATNPPSGYYYDNPIEDTETIIISSRTSIDCTSTSAWIRNNTNTTTSAVLDNDGYITSDKGGSDYYTVCNDLVLTRGMTIELDFMMKNSGMHGYGLLQMVANGPNKLFVFNGTMEERHGGGTQTTQSVATIPTNTLTTIKYEIDSNGYITLTDSNGAHTSNTAFTDNELALMQFCWKHWGSDKSFSIRRLEYY